jgi:pilus assembly protein Flp/PilA
MKYIKKFLAEEDGVTAIEYGLLAALIVVVSISTITAIGPKLKTTFNSVLTGLTVVP